MSLLQVIKYDGPHHILVWKSPKEDIYTGSQLIVGPSQVAIFVKSGQICDVFDSGRYTLNTKNLPILGSLINLPFGNRSPFTAEVYFVNKLNILNIKWGTPVPIQLKDPVYQIAIPLRAFGQYGVAVEDSCLFLQKLVGSVHAYTTEDLSDYFRGLVGSRITDELTNCLTQGNLSFLDASAHLEEFSEKIAARIQAFFSDYGIRLVHFCISSINVPENDPSVKQLKTVLSKQQELSALQLNYHQEKTYDILGTAAAHLNSGGSAGCELGATLGATMSQLAKQTQPNPSTQQNVRFCRHCGTALHSQDAFCPGCGKATRPQAPLFCPACGTPCQPEDRFCTHCGHALSDTTS